MRANVVVLPYDDHDRVVKLLHSLDRTVWSGKVEAILESEKYETLTVDELFSKLMSFEVDHVKDRYGEPERGGSEWEPIKILLDGDENSNKTNTTSNTRLRLTTQVGQAHVATGMPL
jgi:hypothetical protein